MNRARSQKSARVHQNLTPYAPASISPRTLRTRISRVYTEMLRYPEPSALLLSSASKKSKSGDQEYPFHQQSDFRYLTGSEIERSALLLSTRLIKGRLLAQSPVLFAEPTDRKRVLWDGPAPRARQLSDALQAELCFSRDIRADLLKRLSGHQRLYVTYEPETIGSAVVDTLLKRPWYLRGAFPVQFHLAEELLTPLRLKKDKEELTLISAAGALTTSALYDTLPLISPQITEQFVGAAIDFFFRTRGATPGFSTIAAAGRNAATLHHTPSDRRLRNGDLLLIDCGASLHGYSADITRMLPIGGSFGPAQRIAYDGVLRAQTAAIDAIRSGTKVRAVFDVAAEILTETLIELRVLKGKLRNLIKKRAYVPYFPHSIGHTLGLDVHDVGNLRGNEGATLESGMVFTVEPGLYFRKPAGKVPAMGIRIEDDVFVTTRGCKVITEGFPKDPDELESLLAPLPADH
jgi:Xaa-Pro aminopeptidase